MKKPDPYARWQLVGEFMRLMFISSRVENAPAPLNCLLVGPPGDGKTQMILRAQRLSHVKVLSDATYNGLLRFCGAVDQGFFSALVIPDLGTLVGRRNEVAKQSISMLARLGAEGVYEIAVGKRIKDYHGAKASILSAITFDDLSWNWTTLNQNAFLSRVFLIEFDLTIPEIRAMMKKKNRGDMSLLSDFRFPKFNRDNKFLPAREIKMALKYADRAMRWWVEMHRDRPDRLYGFRTADAFQTLLKCSAYLRRRTRVEQRDVDYVERFRPLWENQFRYREE